MKSMQALQVASTPKTPAPPANEKQRNEQISMQVCVYMSARGYVCVCNANSCV